MVVFVTSRPFAQTTQLADRLGIRHELIGRHGGRRLVGLGVGLLERAARLAHWARGRRVDLAVSHNSYAQLLAARWLGVRATTAMDYEFQPANHVAFRLAHRVVVPEAFPDTWLRRYGAAGKASKYPGVKEQLYLADFRPDPQFRRRHGLTEEAVLVVVRPAAEWALYHRGIVNPLVDRLLVRLTANPAVQIVFLPRIPAQAEAVRHLVGGRVRIPETVWEGPELVAAADVVVSGGGTMAREAAVLGTPAYSVFAGRTPAVDQFLAARGRLTIIRSADDSLAIRVERKQLTSQPLPPAETVLQRVSGALLETDAA